MKAYENNSYHMEVSINGGIPKWMVYNGKSQSKMDDLRVPPILGNHNENHGIG
jgi:hypothetical protein